MALKLTGETPVPLRIFDFIREVVPLSNPVHPVHPVKHFGQDLQDEQDWHGRLAREVLITGATKQWL